MTKNFFFQNAVLAEHSFVKLFMFGIRNKQQKLSPADLHGKKEIV